MNEKQQEELKERTKFKAQLRNTEKKEILETEIYLEYNKSLENIHIVIHDLAGTTDEFYSDFTEIECSGNETESEIMNYLVDFWESKAFPFEFFFMPEIPGIVKLGEREYLVYELKTEQKLSYKEIAHILEIEESTVRHHYRNAKAKVYRELSSGVITHKQINYHIEGIMEKHPVFKYHWDGEELILEIEFIEDLDEGCEMLQKIAKEIKKKFRRYFKFEEYRYPYAHLSSQEIEFLN